MITRPRFSVIAPIYNEEGNIPTLYEKIREVMERTGEVWEFILVNDGSRDQSAQLMQDLASHDSRVKTIHFARNFGHQIAVTAGIDYASGDAVVLIDADLQDPPEVILELIERWYAGYEVVYAVREKREGEGWFKRTSAALFYRLIYRITDVDIPVDTGDFRLMDAKVAEVLRNMREHSRFIRGMTSWVGFKQTGVGYVRKRRHAGETKYPLRKMIRFATDAITGFSFFPLRVMLYVSVILGITGLLAIPVISLLRITQGENFFGGQATTIVLVLLVSSFQMFCLFVLGQYVARIYDEARDRPLYVVARTTGFDNTQRVHGVAHGPAQPYFVASTTGFDASSSISAEAEAARTASERQERPQTEVTEQG